MKNKIGRHVVTWMLIICMLVPMLPDVMIVSAAGDENEIAAGSESVSSDLCKYEMVKYTAQDAIIYLDSDKTIYPKDLEGYLFAGWYKNEDHENIQNAIVSSTDVPDEGAYALYVPEHVLGIKAQVSSNLADTDLSDDDIGAIRFVTSVASLNYKEAGFFFTFGENTTEVKRSNSTVYTKLFGIRHDKIDKTEVQEYIPATSFCTCSNYFRTHTFIDIPKSQFDLAIMVIPFWETLDGTIVRGNPVTKCINDGRRTGLYTVKNYEEFVAALAYMEALDVGEATITLAGDIVIPQTITINENRNILIQDDGMARKILRADSFAPTGTRGVMFDVNANASLTFRSTGNEKNPKLTIDGNKTNAKAIGNWAIVTAKAGSVGVNVFEGVQFINNSSTGSGCVIRMEANSGELFIDGGHFKNNETTNSGGVINISTTSQVTINNAVFSDNKGSTGGAIVISGKAQVSIENCKFISNTSTNDGGAINAGGTLTDGIKVKNCRFEKNSATLEGGAITVPTGCGLSLSDCIFTGNIAKKAGSGLATWGNDIRTGAANSFVHISGKMAVEIFHRNTSCINVVGSLTEGSHVVIDWSTDNGTTNRIPQGTKPAIVFDSADVMNVSREYISLGANMVNTDFRLSYNQSEAKAYCVAVTKAADFDSLKNAVSSAQAGVTKNIRLTGDITMTGTMAVKENTEVVIEDDGTARTILRGTNFNTNARGVFFDVNDGAAFTWNPTGTADKPTIIIDGNNANIRPTSGNWAIIVSIGRESNININEGIEFRNNTTTGAGCVVRMQAGTLNINGAAFKDNRAINNYGGVIWLSGGSVANIKNAVFSGNASENRGGGALQICNGTIANIEKTVFMNNSASINGGAICVDGKGTANITDSIFAGNQAKDGGAIYSYGSVNLTGTDRTKAWFTGNIANNGAGNGGAIYLYAGTLTGSGYEFTNNSPDNIGVKAGATNLYTE